MTPEERYAVCYTADRCTAPPSDPDDPCSCGRLSDRWIARLQAQQTAIHNTPQHAPDAPNPTPGPPVPDSTPENAHDPTSRPTTPTGEVRISPNRQHLAWHRPEDNDDTQPWLVTTEDPIALGVLHDWTTHNDVADWTVLTPQAT